MSEVLQIGDVIQIDGASVPRELRDKWWRVEAIDDDGAAVLSQPYLDKELTLRYRPTVPMRRNGDVLTTDLA